MNSRRTFIKAATATTAGTLLAGLPSGWVGSVYADDSPETKTIRFGIIALTDCAPIVMAHELGYFKKFGIESIVSKEASWAVIRDKLSLGENQATHMLIGMPLASTMGLAGSPVKPMVIPWLLNRNGQAITLNNKLKTAGVRKPADVKPLAEKAKAAGEPLAFAMTFPPGTHAMWMRYWLASGGINPDKDVSLITIPPRADGRQHEGGQDGRLLRRRAVEQPRHRGRHRLHGDHHAADVEGPSREGVRVHRGVRHEEPEDGQGDPQGAAPGERRPRQDGEPAKFAEVIARPAYINCPPAIILERLMGKYDYGDGRVEQDPNYMIFSNRNCNYPHQIYGEVVADAVPPLGHDQGRARLRRAFPSA